MSLTGPPKALVDRYAELMQQSQAVGLTDAETAEAALLLEGIRLHEARAPAQVELRRLELEAQRRRAAAEAHAASVTETAARVFGFQDARQESSPMRFTIRLRR